MTTESVARFVTEFSRTSASLPGANVPWLARLRRTALDRFAARGLPGAHDEDWKYTSVAAVAKRAFTAPVHAGSGAVDIGAFALAGMASHRLVFVDGRYAPSLSQIGRLPAGVTLESLAHTLQSAPDALEPLLGEDRYYTVFAALNAAFMADGVYLHLPRGTIVAEPIHALFVCTAPDAAIHPRNVVVAGEGTQATLIEHYAGIDGAAALTNAVTQLFVAADASIAHYKLQQESARTLHIGGVHAAQSRSSRLESHSIALGAALARNDITTSFDAEGCEAELNGLFLASGRQHIDHHTRIDHAQPRGTSREYYKGILDGGARGVFNGKVVVRPDAQKTDARMMTRALLLSERAEADNKPELEIFADDVQCGHGATAGALDENLKFYLMARGIPEPEAEALLIQSFVGEAIETIAHEGVRADLMFAAIRWLGARGT